MNHRDAPQSEPAEHLRFAAYLSELEHITEAEEAAHVVEVLTTPARRWPSPPSSVT